MMRAAGILLCIAATWTLGALATYRPRRCRCGRNLVDDGLGWYCEACDEDPGPLSVRGRQLWAQGVGRDMSGGQ